MVTEERFQRVWRRHLTSVLRYCAFCSASYEAGEDLASETFAKFLQKGASVADDRAEAWLFTVARNECRRHHRRSNQWASVLPQLAPATPFAVDERLEDLAELLEPLTPEERLAVYLRIVEDRPFAAVAAILGKSEQATKKTVYRALSRLRAFSTNHTDPVTQAGGVEHE